MVSLGFFTEDCNTKLSKTMGARKRFDLLWTQFLCFADDLPVSENQ